jgi:hypothetical protein
VQDPRRLGIPLARTLCLLAILVLINYIARGNLSIAAPLLKGELHISASQLGILIAAFFGTYTVLMPVGGWRILHCFVSFPLWEVVLRRPASPSIHSL